MRCVVRGFHLLIGIAVVVLAAVFTGYGAIIASARLAGSSVAGPWFAIGGAALGIAVALACVGFLAMLRGGD